MDQNNFEELNTAAIKAGLKNDCELIYYPTVDSTNTQCKRFLKSGKKPPFLVVASEQTAGRGRQGKSFYSPKNTGIYLSLVLNMKDSENTVGVTTAACVAVCRAIEKTTDIRPKIKWVNDVYTGGKKVCGILCETSYDGSGEQNVIIGIGVNITTSVFPDGIKNAGSLSSGVSREELVFEITNELFKVCGAPFSDFIGYYRSRSMIIGRDITFIKNGVSTRAKALSIDENGGLAVKTEKGEKLTLSTGEITVRED